MTYRQVFIRCCVILAIVVGAGAAACIAIPLIPIPKAHAHEPYDWIAKYAAPSQHVRDAITGRKEDWPSPIGCCGKVDAVTVPLEQVSSPHLGMEIRAKFPDGADLIVTVTAIYGTEDSHGKAWLTRYGCLFVPMTM